MSTNLRNANRDAGAAAADTARTVEATLRLIARAPVPEGLEERVRARLMSASREDGLQGNARLLAWPARPMRLDSDWMRTAAAAAIVAIVAGGGWGVYSRVAQPQIAARPQAAKAIVAPATGATGGGFSSAEAMRVPQTLNGPVLKHAPKNHSGKLAKKAPATTAQGGQSDATQKPGLPAADTAAK